METSTKLHCPQIRSSTRSFILFISELRGALTVRAVQVGYQCVLYVNRYYCTKYHIDTLNYSIEIRFVDVINLIDICFFRYTVYNLICFLRFFLILITNSLVQ